MSSASQYDELGDGLLPRRMTSATEDDALDLRRARRHRLICLTVVGVVAVVACVVGVMVSRSDSSSHSTTASPESQQWSHTSSDALPKIYTQKLESPSGYQMHLIEADPSASVQTDFVSGVRHVCPSAEPGKPALYVDAELVNATNMAFGTLFNTSGQPSGYAMRVTYTNPETGEFAVAMPTSDFLWAQNNLTNASIANDDPNLVYTGDKRGFVFKYRDYVNVAHFERGKPTTFLLPWGTHTDAEAFLVWALRTYALCASQDASSLKNGLEADTSSQKIHLQFSIKKVWHGVTKWFDCGLESVKAALECASAISEEGANPYEDYNCGAGAYDAVKKCICTAHPSERVCHWPDAPEA